MYKSNFEYEFGSVTFNKTPLLQITEFLYEYLPLIDENNKQKNIIMNLEKSWPTMCCLFQLCTDLLGMAVTHLYHLNWYHSFEKYKDMGVVSFSDNICTGMKLRDRKVLPLSHNNLKMNRDTYLVWIRNSQSETTKPLSPITKRKRGDVGAGIQQTCWMCHLHETGKH